MQTIKKLPQHLINKLKAGEIVERPSAVVKELLENAIDAEATKIILEVEKGGKTLIRVKDNGIGMSSEDIGLSVERYATSKIEDESDLDEISSYGFRGEALASIAEVSTFRIQSRAINEDSLPDGMGYELWRDGGLFRLNEIPFVASFGSIVSVEHLFHAIPAREKFLKSESTERNYIHGLFIDYAIVHRDKERTLYNNGKQKYHLLPASSLIERVGEIYQSDRSEKWKDVYFKDENIELFGLVGDASLHFSSQQYIHLYVNKRPVNDKLIKKALMDAYQRQIVPGSYPFSLLFLEISPHLVDVNVHPRKQEVKFLDPGSIYALIKGQVSLNLGDNKVNYAAFTKSPVRQEFNKSYGDGINSKFGNSYVYGNNGQALVGTGVQQQGLLQDASFGVQWRTQGELSGVSEGFDFAGDQVVIVGQLWQSYIVAQGTSNVYYIDQHALAERIAFEKMRTQIDETGFESDILLQPIVSGFPKSIEIDIVLSALQSIGFDISLFSESKVIIHALPKVFAEWKIDINFILQRAWDMDHTYESPKEMFRTILDEMIGMKACKASIKAGQKLSTLEIKQLLEDGMKYVDGMFVCQHGRPSVVKIEKRFVEALFDRH